MRFASVGQTVADNARSGLGDIRQIRTINTGIGSKPAF